MMMVIIAESDNSAAISSSIELKGKILFDESHHQFWTACIDSGLADYASELRKSGYQVDALINGPITYSNLEEYDVLAFPNGFIGKDNFEQGVKPLDDDEIDAIKKFVQEGGGLALFECGWSWPQYAGLSIEKAPINQLGEIFGIILNDDVIHDPTNHYPGLDDSCPMFYRPYIRDNPITKNVNIISNCEGIPSSVTIINSSAEVIIMGDDDSYSDKYSSGRNPPFMALITYGKGKIVMFGQVGFFTSLDGNNDGIKNIYEHDNRQLGLNLMQWLSTSTPMPSKCIGVISGHVYDAETLLPVKDVDIRISDYISSISTDDYGYFESLPTFCPNTKHEVYCLGKPLSGPGDITIPNYIRTRPVMTDENGNALGINIYISSEKHLDIDSKSHAQLADNRGKFYRNTILMYGGLLSPGNIMEYFSVIHFYNSIGEFLYSVVDPLNQIKSLFAELAMGPFAPVYEWIDLFVTCLDGMKILAAWAADMQPSYITDVNDRLVTSGLGLESYWNQEYMNKQDYPEEFITWQSDNYGIKELSCTDERLDLIRWYGQGGYVSCLGADLVGGYGYSNKNACGLPLELAYMHYLASKEKDAWESGNSQEAIRLIESQNNFIKNHLNWIGKYNNAIKDVLDGNDNTMGVIQPKGWEYYKDLTGNLNKFLNADSHLLDELYRRYTIHGRVIDSSGNPLEGALVHTKLSGSDVYDISSPSGGFKLPGLPRGIRYSVDASKNGFVGTSQSAWSGDNLEFVLVES